MSKPVPKGVRAAYLRHTARGTRLWANSCTAQALGLAANLRAALADESSTPERRAEQAWHYAVLFMLARRTARLAHAMARVWKARLFDEVARRTG
jgi:hypothetical protein